MKTRRPKKKILFVIVEGPSDEEALSEVFKELFKNYNVQFIQKHGDLTSESFSNSRNILKTVWDFTEKWIKIYHLKKKDILAVVLVTDLDGCFVDEKVVLEDSSVQEVAYTEHSIVCPVRASIIARNQRKKENLIRLFKSKSIGGVCFSVIFFSRNLEHFLHGRLDNCTDYEKESLALTYYQEFQKDPEPKLQCFRKAAERIKNSEKEVIEFLEANNNSLKANSNLFIEQERLLALLLPVKEK
ncbi:hypothetical protein [uncultured Turicimonas sp.]|uniref:hypothetical protein n=1 Tax=uncultured Turicimonas sp. TaxID=1918607 RepID=UPI003211B144